MKRKLLVIVCLSFNMAFAQEATITVHDATGTTISKFIYGHFAEHLGHCIYDGFYRDGKIRTDIVDALKKIRVPVLRWPGGCFADQYHWRDGIGPKPRKKTVNTSWGMVTEDNSFGTDEFLDLCKRIGCEPYIAGNVGTGTPEEMQSWIEYLNYDGDSYLANLRQKNGHPKPYHVSFWGVGNESWGCGGNMTPEVYADKYKQYATFCKSYPGSPLRTIASGANSDDYNWTETCMKKINVSDMWGISCHYYTIPSGNWDRKGPATGFTESAYFHALKNCLHIEELVNRHSAIMDKYDKEKKVALVVDEWGIWTDVEKGTNPGFLFQQNSLRDALIAASTLNIFNNHADRIRMANLAQTVNVLQALVLTDKDKMLLTPTYYVFDLFKVHQDAQLLPIEIEGPEYSFNGENIEAVNASASVDSLGRKHVTLVNLDPSKDISVTLNMQGNKTSGRIITSANYADVNTFDQPQKIMAKSFSNMRRENDKLNVVLPPKSIVMLEVYNER
jgi:alpha-N-arabinofuranosidase